MTQNKNICKVYVAQVSAILPVRGRSERKFVRKLHENLSDYCEDNDINVIDELYKGFGTPQEIVFEYISLLKPQEISKRINTARYIKLIVISLITIALLIASFFSVYTYAEYKFAKETEDISVEHIIRE